MHYSEGNHANMISGAIFALLSYQLTISFSKKSVNRSLYTEQKLNIHSSQNLRYRRIFLYIDMYFCHVRHQTTTCTILFSISINCYIVILLRLKTEQRMKIALCDCASAYFLRCRGWLITTNQKPYEPYDI